MIIEPSAVHHVPLNTFSAHAQLGVNPAPAALDAMRLHRPVGARISTRRDRPVQVPARLTVTRPHPRRKAGKHVETGYPRRPSRFPRCRPPLPRRCKCIQTVSV